LEVSAAGDGDNGERLFSAFRAARCSIHGILPILLLTRKPERLFHSYVTSNFAEVLASYHLFCPETDNPRGRYAGF